MHQESSYYTTISGLFIAVLLISNITSTKIVDLGILWWFPIVFDGGTLLFPLSYIFADILTEVYGYKRARQTIWLGFLSAGLMSLCIWFIGILPPAADRGLQQEYLHILWYAPRIVLASLIAYLIGELSNARIMATMKQLTKWKHFWLRALWSTVIGQGLDTVIFVLVAFRGILPNSVLIAIIITNYIFKLLIEVVCLPITYHVVGALKRVET